MKVRIVGFGGGVEEEEGEEVRRLWDRRRETRVCWRVEAWEKGVRFGRWRWERRIAGWWCAGGMEGGVIKIMKACMGLFRV